MQSLVKYENKKRLTGVSGIMRVKNDAEFISAAIDSCLDALDELIIVYNDCEDNSPAIIEKMRARYPEKIRVYEYKPKVYSVNLSKEEYEFAKHLPIDSEQLLCNYYNFALSKISYKYAVKIDADQIYFRDELKFWCDVYRGQRSYSLLKSFLGAFFWLYFKVSKVFGNKLGRVLPLIPFGGKTFFWDCYKSFAQTAIFLFDAQISLAGLNIFINNDEWFVGLGKCNEIINILPPYNGTGDHLIFKATDRTFYVPLDSPSYNRQRSDKFSLIERFVGDKFPIPVGVFWIHLNAMRSNVKNRVVRCFNEHSDYFISLDAFLRANYIRDLEKKIDSSIAGTNERALFQLLQMDVVRFEKKFFKW